MLWLIFAGGEGDEEVGIIGLHLCHISGFVARGHTAFGAAVGDDIATLGVRLRFDGEHQSAAGVGAVARHDVHMDGCKAEGTMVARGISQRHNLSTAVLTDKTTVIFGKAFGFHMSSLSHAKVRENACHNLFRDHTTIQFGKRTEGTLQF